jgi:hypothetical protein
MKLITIPQLAELIGCSRVRVWQMLKEKKFKAIKFSHVYAVDMLEAKKILKAQELKKLKKREKNHENSIVDIG